MGSRGDEDPVPHLPENCYVTAWRKFIEVNNDEQEAYFDGCTDLYGRNA